MNGKQRSLQLNNGAPANWQRVRIYTNGPDSLLQKTIQQETPVIYAVISTWHDGDIIEANVKNCFANGCSKVFVLDNDSPDNTVEEAEKAGASIGLIYSTELYDEDLRIRHQNEIIQRETERAGLAELWWMVLDADEFPEGMDGIRLIDRLRYVHPSVRVVGSNCIDLYPTADHQYEIGKHPAECMTMGINRLGGASRYCPIGHWKHSLLKQLNGVADLLLVRGNHSVVTPPNHAAVQFECSEQVFKLFHAPIRREEDARKRLEALCSSGRSKWDDEVTGNNGAVKRWTALDDIFNECWDRVSLPHTQLYGREVVGLTLYPWRSLTAERG